MKNFFDTLMKKPIRTCIVIGVIATSAVRIIDSVKKLK